MPQKTDRREEMEVFQVRIFQWEFLRRNPGYRRDYDALIAKFGPWFKKNGYWYDHSKAYKPREYVFFINEICPVLKKLCRKWQISDPFCPDWTFDERGYYEYAPGWIEAVPTWETAESAGYIWDYGPIELVPGTEKPQGFAIRFRSAKKGPDALKMPRPEKDSRNLLHVKLDTSHPTRELLKRVKRAIELHRRRYPAPSQSKTRRRLDQYPLYLKVWDLRLQDKSFSEIAKQVYSREFSASSSQSLIQRAIDHYDRARELILGGYKDLR